MSLKKLLGGVKQPNQICNNLAQFCNFFCKVFEKIKCFAIDIHSTTSLTVKKNKDMTCEIFFQTHCKFAK